MGKIVEKTNFCLRKMGTAKCILTIKKRQRKQRATSLMGGVRIDGKKEANKDGKVSKLHTATKDSNLWRGRIAHDLKES